MSPSEYEVNLWFGCDLFAIPSVIIMFNRLFTCAHLCLVPQSSLTLCNPMVCILPGSFANGIFFPRKNTGLCCQGFFPTQELNLQLLRCRWILYLLSLFTSLPGDKKWIWDEDFPTEFLIVIMQNYGRPSVLQEEYWTSSGSVANFHFITLGKEVASYELGWHNIF